MAAPTITTTPASAISKRTVTLNGNITATGGVNPTIRGFQFNTVAYPDQQTYEEGSFAAGAFSLNLTNLTPGTVYYFRAYATNSAGTSYGTWETFTTVAASYSVTINGVDRTSDILNKTLVINDVINDQQNTSSFALIDRSGSGTPTNGQEIVITLEDGTILFSGYIITVNLQKHDTGAVRIDITCVDQVWLLDKNLVHETFTSMTDKQIIQSIIDTYCPSFGITTVNVVEGVTIDQISFNYVQPSQALRRIADLTGRNWYIDYSKDIHYFALTQNAAPFNIDSSNTQYIDLKIKKDASQVKNRVYVRGGTKLSDATTFSTKGDGTMRKFVLPDKPHSVSVSVNGVSKTLGVKNIDTSGFDYYLNFEEKYLEQDSGAVVLATTDTLQVTYAYDIPILVAVEDSASILAYGQKEFAIFDKSISTQQAARDRAAAELTDYASNVIEGSFKTYTTGFRTGQYLTINLSSYGVNAQYLVQRVVARSMGAGQYYYEVSIASAKTMGIIRFLIELLEANKNLIELSDQEVVDNLLSLTDSLSSDSLVDALTIDSAGPYSTWCPDSLTASPTTRARWDLFGWG
jgi:hypothetical protein